MLLNEDKNCRMETGYSSRLSDTVLLTPFMRKTLLWCLYLRVGVGKNRRQEYFFSLNHQNCLKDDASIASE